MLQCEGRGADTTQVCVYVGQFLPAVFPLVYIMCIEQLEKHVQGIDARH